MLQMDPDHLGVLPHGHGARLYELSWSLLCRSHRRQVSRSDEITHEHASDISVIGTAGFLGLYLGSGLISGITSLMAQANRPNNRAIGSDGASGAIYGTLSFFAGLFPTQKFLFFFVVPMPAWLLIGGIFTVSYFSVIELARR